MSLGKSSIDTLLEREDCPIEELLKDGDVITECKWGN